MRAYSSSLPAPTCSTMPMLAIASKRSSSQVAVVGDADLDPVGRGRPRAARSRASSACGSDSVMPDRVHAVPLRRVQRRSEPQPQPTSSTRSPGCRPSLRQTTSSLSLLRLLERPRAAARRARRSRSSSGRGRARRTRSRRRSGGGRQRGRARSEWRRPERRASDPGGSGARRRSAPSRRASASAASLSRAPKARPRIASPAPSASSKSPSTSSSPVTQARPKPTSFGSRTTRPSAAGLRTTSVTTGVAPPGGGSSLPSQSRIVNVRASPARASRRSASGPSTAAAEGEERRVTRPPASAGASPTRT